jgi:hypothetical protein
MTGLKLKTIPNFPGQIIGGVGMDIEKTNGNWTVSLDYDDLANTYFLVPTTQLGG